MKTGPSKNLLLVLAVLCPAWLSAVCCAHVLAEAEAPKPRKISVWVADPCVKVDPDGKILTLEPLAGYKEKNAVWDAATGTVNLRAARNQYVSFQVQIEGGAQGVEGIALAAGDLVSQSGRIPSRRFAFSSEFYTQAMKPTRSPAQSVGPGWYPDALIPMDLEGRGTVDAPPDRTQAIWVDLFVPPDAAAGEYTGRLKLASEDGSQAELKLVLEVWSFALPAESHLRWRTGYNENLPLQNGVPFDRRTSMVGEEFLDMELDFYRLCRAHRITPTTHYTSPLPDAEGKGESLTIDWDSYDRRFSRYLDGTAFDDGVPVNIFSLPVNPQSYDGWPSSTRYTRRLDLASFRKALQLTVQHWDEMGWDLNNSFVYVADEPAEHRYDTIKKHCQIIAEVDPRIHRTIAFYRTFGENGPNVTAEFRPYVTHWEIAGDYMLRKALDGVQARGDWVGIYQGAEPFEGGEALDNDGLSLVTWPWIAWIYGLDTLFIYNSTEWNTADIWTLAENHSWGTNSQGVLFYPGLKVGVKRALPCIRLKQMRMGMEDYEYFWLLKQAGRKELADAVARRIIKGALEESGTEGFGDKFYGPGRWERDPARWFDARREMAEAIIAAKQLATPSTDSLSGAALPGTD